MDGPRFDTMTRSVATARSRRRIIGAFVGSVLGLVGLDHVDARACTTVGTICREDANCCTGICGPKNRQGRRTCACPAGQGSCGGQCIGLTDDVHNCGSCGHQCTPLAPLFDDALICSAGTCGCADCPEGSVCLTDRDDRTFCGVVFVEADDSHCTTASDCVDPMLPISQPYAVTCIGEPNAPNVTFCALVFHDGPIR